MCSKNRRVVGEDNMTRTLTFHTYFCINYVAHVKWVCNFTVRNTHAFCIVQRPNFLTYLGHFLCHWTSFFRLVAYILLYTFMVFCLLSWERPINIKERTRKLLKWSSFLNDFTYIFYGGLALLKMVTNQIRSTWTNRHAK